ncbi:MAG: prolipoprotein diacylglyceryl transferase [Alphaproteobacteria bacterium]|nr:MAG: prolipoprotein diacylglyceryl transferase [Alphaproteobacteria bacterium]
MPVLVLPFPMIDPIALELGPLAIRWYGLAYLTGILLGWYYARSLATNAALWGGRPAPMTPLDLDDFLLWAVVGIIVGGRVGYAIFYKPAVYLDDPLAFLRLWEGGMSFHGGMAGTIVAMALFARRRGISALSLFDVIGASATFGLFFGRIANFINAELYGRVTDVPWAMVFPGGGPQPRHPSQLYEAALEGIVLFLVLRLITHKAKALRYPGLVGGSFFAGYGLVRFAVEFTRQPDAHIGFIAGFLTMGMILSLPMIAIGIAAIVWVRKRGPAV